jgi:hypothetical protein
MDTKEAVLEEALRLAGWLLALQAGVAARGETVMPIVCLARDGQDSPQLIAPRGDADSYELHVLAGRIVVDGEANRCRCWVLAYDEDLGPAGKALFCEAGAGNVAVTMAQRYKPGFQLVGDLHLVGEELLPPDVRDRLESCRWVYLVTEGAIHHPEAGERWPAWSAARAAGKVSLQHDRFRFAVPENWCFRPTQSGNGWLMMKLVPWEDRGHEPTIMTLFLSYPEPSTPGTAMQRKQADLLGQGLEVLKAEVSELPSLSVEVARLAWNGVTEGRPFRMEWTWVPTGEADTFLVLAASAFNTASLDSVSEALEGVLASLGRVSAEKPAAAGDSRSWLGKLLGRRKG